jgi:hypothetical protein
MARLVAILGLVVALAAAVKWWEPFLTQQREVITATPSPGPRNAGIQVPLKAGAQLCVAPVVIDRATAEAQFTLSASRTGPVPLTVEPGGTTVRPTLRRSPLAVQVPVTGNGGQGQVCLRNAGSARVLFLATNDPISIGLARTRIDGRELRGQGVELELLEARTQSVLDRLGTIVRHAADFTGSLMPCWLAWLLVVALVVATPFAIFAAFWAALRADEAE